MPALCALVRSLCLEHLDRSGADDRARNLDQLVDVSSTNRRDRMLPQL